MSSIKEKALQVAEYMKNVGYLADYDPIFVRDLKRDIRSSKPTLTPQIKGKLLDFLVGRLEEEVNHGTSPPELQNTRSWMRAWQLIQTGEFSDLEQEVLHVLSERDIYIQEYRVTGILYEVDSDSGASFPLSDVRANSVAEAIEAARQHLKRSKQQYANEHGLRGRVGVDAHGAVHIGWQFAPLQGCIYKS